MVRARTAGASARSILIVVGILLGPVTGLLPREQLAAIAPYFAALTLVVILFDGGIHLRLRDVAQAAPRSGILALLTFSLAVAAVTLVSMAARTVGWLPGSWTWTHGLLLGAILGGMLGALPMVESTHSYFVMEEVKEEPFLDVSRAKEQRP